MPSTSGHRVENVGTLTREQGVCKNFLTLISMLAISEMNGLRREAVEDWRDEGERRRINIYRIY